MTKRQKKPNKKPNLPRPAWLDAELEPIPDNERGILVTGSREANQAMREKARRVTLNLIAKRSRIIVGDAEGVDEEVIDTCNKEKYPYVSVFGAYGKLRRRSKYGFNHATGGSYPKRDVVMAILCRGCATIWNGKSRGTQITFEAVARLKKPIKHLYHKP